jgi:hypothetical protein
MEKKTVITTPYPTVEEVAKTLGVPLRRAREINRFVAEQSGRALAAAREAAMNGGKKRGRARSAR